MLTKRDMYMNELFNEMYQTAKETQTAYDSLLNDYRKLESQCLKIECRLHDTRAKLREHGYKPNLPVKQSKPDRRKTRWSFRAGDFQIPGVRPSIDFHEIIGDIRAAGAKSATVKVWGQGRFAPVVVNVYARRENQYDSFGHFMGTVYYDNRRYLDLYEGGRFKQFRDIPDITRADVEVELVF